MRLFQTSKTTSGDFHIEGFPDAVKLIQLADAKSRRVADLALHRSDLEFARECIEKIQAIPDETDFVRMALWRISIVQYFKCFGDPGDRFQLQAPTVYKDQPPETLLAFEFFKSMRNKNLVHDVNAFSQCSVGAVLNNGTKDYKVEKILALVSTFSVSSSKNVNSLRLLVQHALGWIAVQFDKCTDLIRNELEKVPYDDLLSRPVVNMRVPTVHDVDKAGG